MHALKETCGRSHRSVWPLALAKEIVQAEESKRTNLSAESSNFAIEVQLRM